ncbi:WD40 repeat domain-containing protein [Planctopirus hydrillae]|uniref:Uncharacterized protein n=1 Tax=Planctopirus hydrillae TaxID=1841610 RepID=A0A1C3E680_9PLAN|nr:hypothetical protein [Planctopirus hydrillae]ODA28766.1 hypothetical protein A6X21_10990 [Planctopirus hydrillae]
MPTRTFQENMNERFLARWFYTLFVMVNVSFAPSASFAQDDPPNAADGIGEVRTLSEYDAWVESYCQKSLAGIRLVIITVGGEEAAKAAGEGPHGPSIIQSWDNVSIDGKCWGETKSRWGLQGAGGNTVSQNDLKRLDELLANLPADGSKLPPIGRRVMIQSMRNGNGMIRVYDIANPPLEVLEIFRLSHSGLRPRTLYFRPKHEIDAASYRGDGFFGLTPDRAQIVYSDGSKMQLWEPTTRETLGVLKLELSFARNITFKPDGSLAAFVGYGECVILETQKWKRLHYVQSLSWSLTPRFTLDGKHLLLCSDEKPPVIYETATWKPVARLTDLPEEAVRFCPAIKKRLAVIQSAKGTVSLWNLDKQASVAVLDEDCGGTEAVFSPDETLVATATRGLSTNKYHWRLRVWKTDTGELLHELRPFEQTRCESLSRPLWTPDGKYLLAHSMSNTISVGISVWSLKTGRHRGEFVGAGNSMYGMEMFPENGELIAGCGDGKIRFWDFSSAINDIEEFERPFDGH